MTPAKTRVLVLTVMLIGTIFQGISSAQSCPLPPGLARLPLCSPAITNGSCVIVIERDAPSSPLPVKVKRNSTVTLIVHKRPLDSVTADSTFTDVATPDPVAALFAVFSPSFKNITIGDVAKGLGMSLMTVDTKTVGVPDRARPVLAQLQWIHQQQKLLQATLEKSKKEAADPASEAVKVFLAFKADFTCQWDDFYVKAEADRLKQSLKKAIDMDTGAGLAKGLHEATDTAAKTYAELAKSPTNENLEDIGHALNDVVVLQAELDSSSASLVASAAAARDMTKDLADLTTRDLIYKQVFRDGGQGSRSAAIKVKAEDAHKKAIDLGAVSLVWADTKWEVSTGAVFSALPNRSFENTVQIVNGQIQLTPDGKPNTTITETITRPSIVPFAFGHYRLGETARYDRRWAVLATGGMGISPYSGSTDFAAGVTIGYRAFFISPVAHFARDTRLTSGLKTGDSLGASPPALPTERFWKSSFGIAVTARIF